MFSYIYFLQEDKLLHVDELNMELKRSIVKISARSKTLQVSINTGYWRYVIIFAGPKRLGSLGLVFICDFSRMIELS